MVALQFLVLSVVVRIRLGQRWNPQSLIRGLAGFFFSCMPCLSRDNIGSLDSYEQAKMILNANKKAAPGLRMPPFYVAVNVNNVIGALRLPS